MMVCVSHGHLVGQEIALSYPVHEKPQKPPKATKTIKNVLAELEAQHNVSFAYEESLIAGKYIVYPSGKAGNLAETRNELLAPLNLKVEKINPRLFLIVAQGQQGQKAADSGSMPFSRNLPGTLKADAKALEEVMDMGIYDLWPTYAQVFDIANENGRESVFSIQQVSGGVGQGSNYMTFFARENSPITGRGWGSFQPTKEVIDTLKAVAGDTRFGVNLMLDPVDNNYYINKYFDADATAASNQDNNWIVLRYADVLLIYAEALNELGAGNPEAYKAINMVRRRAFGESIKAVIPQPHDLLALSQGDFRKAVYGERRFELAFEGHRWFDLVRTGRLVSTMQAKGSTNIKPFHILFPVPQDEISLNPKLGQNEGYN